MDEAAGKFVRPFDLSRAPLLRVGILKDGTGRWFFMMDTHHIINDGVSMGILTGEFWRLVKEAETGVSSGLPLLKLQYKDFARWQTSPGQVEAVKKQEAFWLERFQGEIPVLNLPADYTRPALQRFDGAVISSNLDRETTGRLNRLARTGGTTLYMVLAAIYNVFLSVITGQEDIIMGTGTAGRGHAQLQSITGFFVNTLPLRNYPCGEKTFRQFLKELEENTLTAFENQDYPFEKLVEHRELKIKRDPGRGPLFDVMFMMQNMELQWTETGGPEITPYHFDGKTAKFDLSLLTYEKDRELALDFEYSTKLFKERTITRFVRYFKTMVKQVLGAPDRELASITLMDRREQRRLLGRLNAGLHVNYPREQTVHRLFSQQARRTPGQIALVYDNPGTQTLNPGQRIETAGQKKQGAGNIFISFKDLDGGSAQLACLLRKKGVRPGAIVGLMMGRRPGMITGVLGILKAGGAYLPMDPHYPQKRISYMLKDSGANVLVTAAALAREVEKLRSPELNGNPETIFIDPLELPLISTSQPPPSPRLSSPPASQLPSSSRPPGFPASRLPSSSLSYIIYTSGTTGRPRGVMVEHRNVVRLFINEKFQFDFSGADVWTLFHSISFDFSVWEIFGALLFGGKLVIVTNDIARSPTGFARLLTKHHVTVLNQVPSIFLQVSSEVLKLKPAGGGGTGIRYLIFGGEALNPAALKPWRHRFPSTRFINMYGITETTVHVTFKAIGEKEISTGKSNIGKPIPTLSVYIVDKALRLQPVGLAGQLAVGGEGVARGYMNRPQLTAEKFGRDLWNYRLIKNYKSPIANIGNQNTTTGNSSNKKFVRGEPVETISSKWGRRPQPQKALREILKASKDELVSPVDAPKQNNEIPMQEIHPLAGPEAFGSKNEMKSRRKELVFSAHFLKILKRSAPPGRRGQKNYFSGDLGMWLDNGDILYMGRGDHQVKVRGYRIELGEIESRLSRYPGVGEAVVMARRDKSGGGYLCAYLVMGVRAPESGLREFLSARLPGYMVPGYFVQLSRMPVTASGKVDREALPDPRGLDLDAGAAYVAPRGPLEKQLADIWRQELNRDKIGITDDFFEIGGHSLKALAMVARIRRELKVELPVTLIFQHPYIRDLARYIARGIIAQKEDMVVRLNKENQRKIFALPPIIGVGISYKALALELPDCALYAFNYIEGEDKIQRYIEAITAIQPGGPYRMLGYSSGGSLAFAIAREMEKQGYHVSDLIFFDVYRKQRDPMPTERRLKWFRKFIADLIDRGQLEGMGAYKEEVIRRSVKYLEYVRGLSDEGTVKANIHNIAARGRRKRHYNRWKDATTGNFYVYQGCSRHGEFLVPEIIRENLPLLKEIINKI